MLMIVKFLGKNSRIDFIPGDKTAARDSIPSTYIPSSIFENTSTKLGYNFLSCVARFRTSSVINNSRHGMRATGPITGAKVR